VQAKAQEEATITRWLGAKGLAGVTALLSGKKVRSFGNPAAGTAQRYSNAYTGLTEEGKRNSG